MDTITISRQMGSLGTEVAREVAGRLGYRMVYRELIDQAARQAGTPEVALATIDELGLLGLRPSQKDRQAYLSAVQQVVESLAAEGKVVIVGRASQVILRDHPGVLRVRVIAPAHVRIARIAQRRGIALDKARAQVEASDRSRKNYLRRFYGVRLDDPELYDLILNTGRLDVETAAELICQAL